MNKAEQMWAESEAERIEIEGQVAALLERFRDCGAKRTILANELGKLGLDVQEVARKSAERSNG